MRKIIPFVTVATVVLVWMAFTSRFRAGLCIEAGAGRVEDLRDPPGREGGNDRRIPSGGAALVTQQARPDERPFCT